MRFVSASLYDLDLKLKYSERSRSPGLRPLDEVTIGAAGDGDRDFGPTFINFAVVGQGLHDPLRAEEDGGGPGRQPVIVGSRLWSGSR